MKYKAIVFFLLIMSLFSAQIYAQTAVKLSGVITAADAGHPLAGANISVQGTLLGAAAQNDGSYELNLMPGSYTLLVQYIGYRTIKAQVNVVVDQPLSKNFALEEDVLQMSEVAQPEQGLAAAPLLSHRCPLTLSPLRKFTQPV